MSSYMIIHKQRILFNEHGLSAVRIWIIDTLHKFEKPSRILVGLRTCAAESTELTQIISISVTGSKARCLSCTSDKWVRPELQNLVLGYA